MKIHTDSIEHKKYDCSIRPCLHKHSQEYRVLATLRYLLPEKFMTMTVGESPDLQDCSGGVGIEVTEAVKGNDMKAGRAFSTLCKDRNGPNAEMNKEIIKASGYSLYSASRDIISIGTTGTLDGEKKCFQNSIRKKREKIQKYKCNFNTLGLAVFLPEIPTFEAESCLIDWIREVFQESDNSFDFVYVLSHRFCIYYENRTDIVKKWAISSEENQLLGTIARMTAEGELTLEDQEWQ